MVGAVVGAAGLLVEAPLVAEHGAVDELFQVVFHRVDSMHFFVRGTFAAGVGWTMGARKVCRGFGIWGVAVEEAQVISAFPVPPIF